MYTINSCENSYLALNLGLQKKVQHCTHFIFVTTLTYSYDVSKKL